VSFDPEYIDKYLNASPHVNTFKMNAHRAILSDKIRHILERELRAELPDNQINVVQINALIYKAVIHIRGNSSVIYDKTYPRAAYTNVVQKQDVTEKIVEDVLDDLFRRGRPRDSVDITSKLSTIHTKECFTPREIHKFIADAVKNTYTHANFTVMHDEGVVTTATSIASLANAGVYITDFATYADDQELPIIEFRKKCRSAKVSIAAIKRAITMVRPHDHSLVTTEIIDRTILLNSSKPEFYPPDKESMLEELINVTWMPENLRLTMDETEYAQMTNRWT
jgi:hypothetical protein